MKEKIKAIYIIISGSFTFLLWPIMRANYYESISVLKLVGISAIMNVITIITLITLLNFYENCNYYKKFCEDYNKRAVKKIVVKYGVLSVVLLAISLVVVSKFTWTFVQAKEVKDVAEYKAIHTFCPMDHTRVTESRCPVCGLSGYDLYVARQYREFTNDYQLEHINFSSKKNCKNNHLMMREDECPYCGQSKEELEKYIPNSYVCTRCGNRYFDKFEFKCSKCSESIITHVKSVEFAAEEFSMIEDSWTGDPQENGKIRRYDKVKFCGNDYYFEKFRYNDATKRKLFRTVLDIMSYMLEEDINFNKDTGIEIYISVDNELKGEKGKVYLKKSKIQTLEEVEVLVKGMYGEKLDEEKETELVKNIYEKILVEK